MTDGWEYQRPTEVIYNGRAVVSNKETVVLCRWGVEMNVWFINRVELNWPL